MGTCHAQKGSPLTYGMFRITYPHAMVRLSLEADVPVTPASGEAGRRTAAQGSISFTKSLTAAWVWKPCLSK